MTDLNHERTIEGRKSNPNITPYDTGEMLQPIVWHNAERDPMRYGKVDFDNDEGATEFTLFAHPSTVEEDCITVQIDPLCVEGRRMQIIIGEQVVYLGQIG